MPWTFVNCLLRENPGIHNLVNVHFSPLLHKAKGEWARDVMPDGAVFSVIIVHVIRCIIVSIPDHTEIRLNLKMVSYITLLRSTTTVAVDQFNLL